MTIEEWMQAMRERRCVQYEVLGGEFVLRAFPTPERARQFVAEHDLSMGAKIAAPREMEALRRGYTFS